MGPAVTGTEVVTRHAAWPSSGTLALRSDQNAWTATQRAALDQIGVGDAPEGDLQVFLHVAQRSGLDPFSRQIYMIGRWDGREQRRKWTIQTGIDGFRIIAERHKQYAGQVGPQWCGEDGRWRDVWAETVPPTAARVGVVRHDWQQPLYATVMFGEFAERKRDNGELTPMWGGKSAHMIAKVAEAHALRKAFPQDLSGMYTEDEMAHVDNPPERVVVDQQDDAPAEPDWDALIGQAETARDRIKLGELWKLARGLHPNDTALLDHLAAAGERVKQAEAEPDASETTASRGEVSDRPDPADTASHPAGRTQMKHIFALLDKVGIKSDEARHRAASHALDRDIATFKDLTADDASRFITRLEQAERDREAAAAPSDEGGSAS